MISATWLRAHLPAVVAVLCCIIAAAYPITIPMGDDFTTPTAGPNQTTVPLTGGATITQDFPSTGTAIETITMTFGTYLRENHEQLTFRLQQNVDNVWQTIVTRPINEEELPDNLPYTIVFSPPIPVRLNTRWRISLASNENATQGVTWFRSLNPFAENTSYTLRADGHVIPGTALFQVTYARTPPRPLAIVVFPFVTRVTVLLNGFWKAVFLIAAAALVGSVFFFGRSLPD